MAIFKSNSGLNKWRQQYNKNLDTNDYMAVIAGAAADIIKEQQKLRRWKIISRIFFIGIALFFVVSIVYSRLLLTSVPHTAVIDIHGVIAEQETASAKNIMQSLNTAFANKGTQGIILNINSPGGSPVQAGLIFDEIMRLRQNNKQIKVYAVVSDICASGAYYIAAATDKIYAHKSSLVGSIGVISASFGLDKFISQYKIDRRVMTAGEDKAFLDTFSPLQEKHKNFWQKVLDDTHKQFITDVRLGRGDKLDPYANLFTGLIWNGNQALNLGLIDGIASIDYVAREIIQEENIINITVKNKGLAKIMNELGASISRGAINSLTAIKVW